MKFSKKIQNSMESFTKSFYVLQAEILKELESEGLYNDGYAMYMGERVLIKEVLVSHECEVNIHFEKENGYEDIVDVGFFTPLKDAEK
jgi:hypothetical protein